MPTNDNYQEEIEKEFLGYPGCIEDVSLEQRVAAEWFRDTIHAPAMKEKDADLEKVKSDQAIQFATWIADQMQNNEHPFILTDAGWYYEPDKEGDMPISESDLYELFLKERKGEGNG